MKTLALRFSDRFAPSCGTIEAHNQIIINKGYVWFGKIGTAVSVKTAKIIMNNDRPRILLIHSGKQDRYWAYVKEIKWEIQEAPEIPSYYLEKKDLFKTWFKIDKIVSAEKDIMSRCKVISSGAILSVASKKSMSSFFVIEYNDEQISR